MDSRANVHQRPILYPSVEESRYYGIASHTYTMIVFPLDYDIHAAIHFADQLHPFLARLQS